MDAEETGRGEDIMMSLTLKEQFVNDQIALHHRYLHNRSPVDLIKLKKQCDECLYVDAKLIICLRCKTFSFEAKSATDENDTYLWIECKTCHYQHGVSH